jgi:hypothetical protein
MKVLLEFRKDNTPVVQLCLTECGYEVHSHTPGQIGWDLLSIHQSPAEAQPSLLDAISLYIVS